METIKINVRINAAAAVRAGHTYSGTAAVPVNGPVLAACGEALAAYYEGGAPTLDVADTDDATVVAAVLSWRAAKVAAARAQADAKAAKIAATDAKIAAHLAARPWASKEKTYNGHTYRRGDGLSVEARAMYQEISVPWEPDADECAHGAAFRAAQIAANTANDAARQIAAAAARAEVDAAEVEAKLGETLWIDKEIETLNTFLAGSAKERFDEGVLPANECDQLLEDDAFSPLASFQRYQRIDENDLCDDCHDGKVSMTDEDVWSAPAWEVRSRILAAAPDVRMNVRTHTGKCECGEAATVERESILVRRRDRTGVIRSRAFAV